MLETGSGISRRTVRLWLGDHLGLLLVVLVFAYLFGFFLYHTFVTVNELVWQDSARYDVGDSCALLIEYPARISLQDPNDSNLPITARLWWVSDSTSGTLTGPVSCSAIANWQTYFVEFGPLGEGLEFVDKEGTSVAATLAVEPGLSESSAPPARLYVRRAPSDRSEPVSLQVQVGAADGESSLALLNTILTDPAPPVILPESERASRWRHFLGVLFTPGPLQWMFTAIAGIVGVWEIYKNLQERREERREKVTERRRVQRERIGALRDLTPPERGFDAYQALRTEFRDDPEMLEELQNAFNPDWLPYLRQQLGRYLRAGQLHDAQDLVRDMEWEWRQSSDERTYVSVQALIEYLREPGDSPSRLAVGQVLAGFRGVGLEATKPVVNWLAKCHPDLSVAGDVLFREGGAAGRYLLHSWGERDGQVRKSLREWEQAELPPVRRERGPLGLWARERGESLLVRQGVQRMGLDFNPFGPEKAEQDPLLPDLFHRLSPVWEELTAPQPSILIAPPGCGRSALIWMVRYQSGLVGSSLEDAFAVFAPVHACASSQELAQDLQSAISAALCRTLARDPYALLGLEEADRRGLADLLLRSTGGLTPLIWQLRGAGLSQSDPDGQLLQEALALVARSKGSWEDTAHWDAPRFHPYGREYTFLLMDVSFQDGEMVDLLLESLFDRWLPSLAPRHVIPKVFVSSEPGDCPVTPVPVKWDEDSLRELLQHRLQQAGLVLQEDQPLLHGWFEGLADLDSALIEQSNGCPARLIGLGNRMIRQVAQ